MGNVQEIIRKGKVAAKAGYQWGNELMDKVPALKSRHNKMVVWCLLALLSIVAIVNAFGGSAKPFAVAKETMVALAEGDLETFFWNVYWPRELKDRMAKLSDTEVKVLEKAAVQGFIDSFSNLSEDEQKLMAEAYLSMRCEKETINGDDAKVEVKLRKVGGEEGEATFYLKKDDGEWKLDVNNLAM